MYLCHIIFIAMICFFNFTSLDCARIVFDKELPELAVEPSDKTTGNNGFNGNKDNEYAASVIELKGNQEKPLDKTSVHKKHLESKKGSKASKFGEKKGHKKGHHTRGYHNRFHKDEYHKEHKLYDDPTKRSNHK